MKKIAATGTALVLLLVGCSTAPISEQQVAASKPCVTSDAVTPAYPSLTIYSALPEEEIPVYLSEFERDTGITVHCTRMSSGDMVRQVQEEQAAPQASVLLGGAVDNYVMLSEEGVLAPYQSPELKQVPEQYLDKKGIWNPIYIGVICFACNQEWFAQHQLPYPTCWKDLLRPELKGQIVMGDPKASGTSYTMLATLVQLFGEDAAFQYLRQLHQNILQYTPTGTELPDMIGQGEAAVGIVFSHDGRKPALNGYPVELAYPSDGTGYEIGACALMQGGPADERDNACRFIDWMTSQRGQECYIEAKSSRLPVNTNAHPADGLPALEQLNIIEYDPIWAGKNRKRLVQRFYHEICNVTVS